MMHINTVRRMYQKGTGPKRVLLESIREALGTLPEHVLSKSHKVGFYTIKGTQMCRFEVKLLLEGRDKFVSKIRKSRIARTT